MSLLFESIRVNNGVYENLVYHEQRMRRSVRELFGTDEAFDLEDYLREKPTPVDGMYKCKLVYDDTSRQLEFLEYRPRTVRSLKIVEHDRINYEFKYADRATLDHLYALKGTSDDVLIVKRGLVTDTTFANVAFRRGKEWVTPWQPLLKGTMRQKLLEYGTLQEEEIRIRDVGNFEAVKIFNAMLRFDSEEIPIGQLVF